MPVPSRFLSHHSTRLPRPGSCRILSDRRSALPLLTEIPVRFSDSPTLRAGVFDTQVRASNEISAPTDGEPELDWPRISGYAVHSIIGSGGMGVVFKAKHR